MSSIVSELPLIHRSVQDVMFDLLHSLNDDELKKVVEKFGTGLGVVDEWAFSSWVSTQINSLNEQEEMVGLSFLLGMLNLEIHGNKAFFKPPQLNNVIGLYPSVKSIPSYNAFIGSYRLEGLTNDNHGETIPIKICDASGSLSVQLKLPCSSLRNGAVYCFSGVKKGLHYVVELS
ncbi:hypothetical protein MSP8887_00574 [Marinomonas spartinae]|uniref:hypothetical protein n=1 Tax=Marinomonas spartinae TaxID=1792290 RepID=UPI000809003B|nr:hypothetical protein [Marinomonas spartinae]SBS27211.1 hypothetical protein MSP8887_00574 [Marinomonas spartinae]